MAVATLVAWPHLPDLALRLLGSRLADRGVAISWRSARLDYGSRIEATDVRVAWRPAGGGRTLVVEVPRVSLGLGLASGTVVIEEAVVERPRVGMSWSKSDDGLPSRASSGALPLRVGRLAVTEGHFSFDETDVGPVTIEVADVDAIVGGAGARFEGSVTTGAVRLDVGSRHDEARAVKGRAILDATGLTIEDGHLETGRSSVAVSGRIEWDGALSLALAGGVDLLDVTGPGLGDRLAGHAEVVAAVTRAGSGADVVVRGRAAVPAPASVFGFDVVSPGVRFSVTRAGMLLCADDLRTPTGGVAGGCVAVAFSSGADAGGGTAYSCNLAARMSLSEVRGALAIDLPFEAELDGDVRVRGGGSNWEVAAWASGDGVRLRDVALGPVAAELRADATAVDVSFRPGGGDGASAVGSAHVDLESHRTEVTIEQLHASVAEVAAIVGLDAPPFHGDVAGSGVLAFAGDEVSSRFDARLTARGAAPTVAGHLLVENAALIEADVEIGGVTARFSDGRIDAVAPTSWALMETVGGLARMFGGAPPGPMPLETERIALRGDLRLPPAGPLAFDLAVDAVAPSAYGVTCESGSARLALDGAGLRISAIDARCEGGRLEGGLEVDPAGGLVGELDVRDLPLPPALGLAGGLDARLCLSPGAVDLEATATVGARGRVTVSARGPDLALLQGSVAAHDVPLPGLPEDSAKLSLRLEGDLAGGAPKARGVLALEADAATGLPGLLGTIVVRDGLLLVDLSDQTQAVVVQGQALLSDPFPFRVYADVRGFEPSTRLADLLQATLGVGVSGAVEARVTGTAELTGSRAGLGSFGARVTEGRLAVAGRTIVTRVAGSVDYEDGKLGVPRLDLEGPGLLMTAELSAEGAPMVTADLDLSLLEEVLPETLAMGRVHVEYGGTPAVLEATVEDGSISHPALPVPIAELRGRVRYTDGTWEALDVKGRLGDGPFLIDGKMSAASGQLQLRVFPVTLPSRQMVVPGLRGAVGGRVTLERDGDELKIGGVVRLTRGAYHGDVDLAALAASGPSATPEDWGPRLDLVVMVDDPLRIKNNVLDGRLKGALSLHGTLGAPGIEGRLALEDGGRLFLRGQRYDVERAVVGGADLLAGAWRAELRAAATIQDYQVTLDIDAKGGGRGPGQIRLDYGSIPSLPEEDVQALIVFGTTAEHLPPGTAEALTGALLLAPIVRQIEGGSSRLLGVDRVRIGPYISQAEETTAARVTIEKDLGENLSVIYSTSASQSREDLVVLEYSGLPFGLKARATREIDGSVTVEIGGEVQFGVP